MYREGHGPKGAEGGARAEGGQAGAPAARGGETASPRGEGEGEAPLYKDGRELVESGRFVLVPRYDVQASAGPGAVVTSEQVVDHLAFRTEWVKRMGLDPKRLALISVVGDSMEPTLSEGDLVLIDTRITSIRSNAIYAIARGDEIVIKRMWPKFDGTLIIKSDNPIYGDEEVPADIAAELRVIGRVTWCGKRM